MRIKTTIVAYAFSVQCFVNATIVAYAGLRVKTKNLNLKRSKDHCYKQNVREQGAVGSYCEMT